MKKKIIVLSLFVLVFAACFIPVTQQITVHVKAPFLNVFNQLSEPLNWEKWRPDLNKVFLTDSDKIAIKKDGPRFFQLKYQDRELNVRSTGYTFFIHDRWNNKISNYSYTVTPVYDKFLNKSSVTVDKKTYLFNYLLGKISSASFEDTHVNDLKNFMENDSLHYGCTIFRTKVSDTSLIVIKREVLEKDKFNEASKMLPLLQQYLKTHHDIKQTRPLIAQFLPKGKDSTEVKIGIFINKKVNSENEITYSRMPKGGTFYIGEYKGRFDKRGKVYAGMKEYFASHLYQLALIPFETYLDNKLPVSDTDSVNIQVVFPSYF
jgi:effector-binding domain-containing protein